MDKDKERQEISLIGRLFSMEALLVLMGLFSLISGIVSGAATQIFWGVVIIGGAVVLHFVRKKDWKKHWEEQEQMRQTFYEKRKRDEDKGQ